MTKRKQPVSGQIELPLENAPLKKVTKEHSRIPQAMNQEQIATELSLKNKHKGKSQVIYKKDAKPVQKALSDLESLGINSNAFARHALWLRNKVYQANWPLMQLSGLETRKISSEHLVPLHYKLIEHPETTHALKKLEKKQRRKAQNSMQTVFDAMQNRINQTTNYLIRQGEQQRKKTDWAGKPTLKANQTYEDKRTMSVEAVKTTRKARIKYLKKLSAQ